VTLGLDGTVVKLDRGYKLYNTIEHCDNTANLFWLFYRSCFS